jgi:hypothetical protein
VSLCQIADCPVCGVLQESGWQERAPRSISKDYDVINSNAVLPGRDAGAVGRTTAGDASANNAALASGTSRPVATQLSDVFISVKTTRNYHKWRLPVVLKTWFQLAKDQVRLASDITACSPQEVKRRFGVTWLLHPQCRMMLSRACFPYVLTVKMEATFSSECGLNYTVNVVFWDVTPCGSCKNRRFGET